MAFISVAGKLDECGQCVVKHLHSESNIKALSKLRTETIDRKHGIKFGPAPCAYVFLGCNLPIQYMQTKPVFYNCRFIKV